MIALGSNLGDRALNLRRAIDRLGRVVTLVRVSSFHDTAPVDAPQGSPRFLNAVVAAVTTLSPADLLGELLRIERELGRVRGRRNAPRTLDLDLILHGARLVRTASLTVPHPRYLERDFVRIPLRELKLGWSDPATGTPLG